MKKRGGERDETSASECKRTPGPGRRTLSSLTTLTSTDPQQPQTLAISRPALLPFPFPLSHRLLSLRHIERIHPPSLPSLPSLDPAHPPKLPQSTF